MRILLFLITSFLTLMVNAQVEFSTTKHDFGDLEVYSARYVDIILTNKGSKQEWLLSIKKPREVIYIQSKQFIEKDSSIVVRLHVDPKEKGKFNYNIQIYVSDRNDPVDVKLTGNLRGLPEDGSNAMTACPSFNERPGGSDPNGFDLTVVTIDKEDKHELSESTVTLLQNGRPIWTEKTDKRGQIKEDATLGLSYFYAKHDGYYPAELGAYINFKRKYIVIELERQPQPVEPAVIEEPIAEVDTITIEVEPPVEENIEETLAQEETTEIPVEVPPALSELDPNNFDKQYFDPVNVVFVLDVSMSMRSADKMELMKYALFQLTDMLRAQDKFGIVTYSSDAQVLLRPTSGDKKDAIKEEIEDLQAFGYTAGGKGIKLGFKQAKRGKINGGVNHVIVITDGAFNRDSDDYKRYIKKYKRQGINLSVVGIKSKEVQEQEMKEVAELGGGHFIPIQKLSDAQQNLNQAIRILTFKH